MTAESRQSLQDSFHRIAKDYIDELAIIRIEVDSAISLLQTMYNDIQKNRFLLKGHKAVLLMQKSCPDDAFDKELAASKSVDLKINLDSLAVSYLIKHVRNGEEEVDEKSIMKIQDCPSRLTLDQKQEASEATMKTSDTVPNQANDLRAAMTARNNVLSAITKFVRILEFNIFRPLGRMETLRKQLIDTVQKMNGNRVLPTSAEKQAIKDFNVTNKVKSLRHTISVMRYTGEK